MFRSKLVAILCCFAWLAATVAPVQAAQGTENVPANYNDYSLATEVGGDPDLGAVPDLPTLKRKFKAKDGAAWAKTRLRTAFDSEVRLRSTLEQAHARRTFTDDHWFSEVATLISRLILSGQVTDGQLKDGQLFISVSQGSGKLITMHRRLRYDMKNKKLAKQAQGWEFWVKYLDVAVRLTIPKKCGNLCTLTAGIVSLPVAKAPPLASPPPILVTRRKVETEAFVWTTEGPKSSWHLNSNGSMAQGPPPNIFVPQTKLTVNGSSATSSSGAATATGGTATAINPPLTGRVNVGSATAGATAATSVSGATVATGGPGGGPIATAVQGSDASGAAATTPAITITFGNSP